MALREFAAVFARLSADRTQLNRDLAGAVKDSAAAGSEIEKGFKRPFTTGFVSGVKQADAALADLGTSVGKFAGVITNPWAIATAGVAALGGALLTAVQAGLEFDREFTKIAVLLDEGVNAEELRQNLLALPPELGKTTDAMKVFRAALVEVQDTNAALEITKVALALGKVLDANPVAVAKAMTAISDSFGLAAKDAEFIGNALFVVAQQGGGSIEELQQKLGPFGDALANLGFKGREGVKQISGALIGLGEVSGQSADLTAQALNKILTSVGSNVEQFRDIGVPIDALVQQFGPVIGALKALEQATGGNRKRLEEMGVPAKQLNTVLKAMSSEGLAAINKGMETFQQRQPAAVFQALAKHNKALSSEFDRWGLSLDKAGEKGGDFILGFLRDKGPLPLKGRIAELNKELDALDYKIDLVNKVNPGQTGLLDAQKKSVLERRDALQKVLDTQEQLDQQTETSAEKQQGLDRTLSKAAQDRLDKLLDLEKKVSSDREDLAAERSAKLVKLLSEERQAEADTAVEKVAIRRQEVLDVARIEDDRLLEKRAALQREKEDAQTNIRSEIDRRTKVAELDQQLDKLDDQLKTNQQDRASKLRTLERESTAARFADEDKYFALRRALGDASLRDEINRLRQISTESKRTNDERLDALKNALEKERALRDQSRSAALGLIDEVQKSFESQGISTENITKQQFDAEVSRLQSLKESAVATSASAFQFGGGQSLENLKQAVTYAGQLEETQRTMQELGGLGGIFSQAFSIPGEVGQNVLALRQHFADLTVQVQSNAELIRKGYVDAMTEVAQTVDRTMTEIEGRVKVANGEISRSIIEATKTDIAKELDREAKRY